ncbi:hypothetical protein CVT25_010497 [Psilocybe cyanescens]|uniref:Uncharacterized protein n=1 Tax=Psilocybe cyanescens TaxID=93625 RepID=A0A409WDC9_PSICY|nr:hypothetical protein CVT25_010497 [Psilocybe cyanescens]
MKWDRMGGTCKTEGNGTVKGYGVAATCEMGAGDDPKGDEMGITYKTEGDGVGAVCKTEGDGCSRGHGVLSHVKQGGG